MKIHRTSDGLRIEHSGPLCGSIRPPGSKSHTNRCLMMAALADGVSTLEGVSQADDAQIMIDNLRRLGFEITLDPDAQRAIVTGRGGHLPAVDAALDAGAAGTAMRFLTALCTAGRGRYRIDGNARMRRRPIGLLVEALNGLGAAIDFETDPGYPPLNIVANGLAGGSIELRHVASSQFVSAILMIAPTAVHDVFLRVVGDLPSRPYVDMTLAAMREFGVEALSNESDRWIVPGSQRYAAGNIAIEPDASAATYFWAAAAITGGRIAVHGLSRESLQGDVGFVDVLAKMGCIVSADRGALCVSAPKDRKLRGVNVDLNAMPDTVQTLAVTALFAEGPTTIRNVANLRVKETDRLTALQIELAKLGAGVVTDADSITISPPSRLNAAAIDTYDDHRMAMSFALASLAASGVEIRNPTCVSKSYPGFFDALAKIR